MEALEEPGPGEVHGEEGVHVGGEDLVQELFALDLKRGGFVLHTVKIRKKHM